MKFLTEKTTMLFAIILVLVSIMTNDWAKIKEDVGGLEFTRSDVNFGLFNACDIEDGCSSISKTFDSDSKKDKNAKNNIMICQVTAIGGLIFLVASFACDFSGKCQKNDVGAILAVIGAVMLLICLTLFSQKVKPAVVTKSNDKSNDSSPTDPGKTNFKVSIHGSYNYSFYLFAIATVLALVGSVAGFMEKKSSNK
jgi:hypothetical protein